MAIPPRSSVDSSDDAHRNPTSRRKLSSILASSCFLLATIFLILVNVGNVSTSPGLPSLYMFKLDVSNIVPESVPNAQLVNSLARTIGLRDFYQVGMWDYCEGYKDEGVTSCSRAKLLFWFNPVEIITSQLLAGATIALPSQVTTYLNIIRVASHIMFGCFLASTLASFVLVFLAPLALYSRLWTIPIATFALAATLAVVIAAGISTGMWTIFANAIKKYATELNITPDVGNAMLAIQWVAAAFSSIGALLLLALVCCGTSRRDIRTGRRTGRVNTST